MDTRNVTVVLILLLVGALLAACGGSAPDPALGQDEIDIAVAATLTAVAPAPQGADVEDTQAPTSTLAPTVTAAPAGDNGDGDAPAPPATAPPPGPTAPPPSPTPLIVAVLPVDGGGNEFPNIRNANPVKDGRNVTLPGFSPPEVSEPMVFRDRMVFRAEVFDAGVGTTDGAGIDHVRFTVFDERGEQVHFRQENTAGYCVFGGGEPACNVWVFAESGYRWPDGAQLTPGLHSATIDIQPHNGEPVQWFWTFRVEVPAVNTGSLAAQINGIALDDTGAYAVEFETAGFTPALPGQHVHFFFDTVLPEQAGLPGGGPWKVYGGPSPFTEYGPGDRPAGATQMCVLVANADHSVQPNTGNCFPLP